MNDQSFTMRNRTLLVVLAAAGIFVGGCLTGLRLNHLYLFWSAPARPRVPRMAVVDGDGRETARRFKSELRSAESLHVSEYPDRSAAQKDLAANKIDIVVWIRPDFNKRVEEIDLADIFDAPHGRLDGTLASLGMEIETAERLAGASQTVEILIYSCAVRTISFEVLERTDPVLAHRLAVRIMRARQQADKSR